MTTQTPTRTTTRECTVAHEPGGLAVVSVWAAHGGCPDIADLRRAISSATSAPGCRWVVFDLCAVEYMDSDAFSALIGCRKLLEGRGGATVLSGSGPNVLRFLQMTRLCKIFAMADSVEDGRNHVARLRRSPSPFDARTLTERTY